MWPHQNERFHRHETPLTLTRPCLAVAIDSLCLSRPRHGTRARTHDCPHLIEEEVAEIDEEDVKGRMRERTLLT